MRRFASLLVLAPLALGCTIDQPADPPAPPAEAPVPAPAQAEPEPTPAPAEVADPLQTPDVTPVQDLSNAIQQLGRLMTKIREAVREAGENAEGDDCAKARVIFLASNDALRAAIEEEPLPGGRTPPFWQVPAEARFAELCHSLPAELQRCLRLDVRAEERTCAPMLRSLPEDQKAIVDQLAQSVSE